MTTDELESPPAGVMTAVDRSDGGAASDRRWSTPAEPAPIAAPPEHVAPPTEGFAPVLSIVEQVAATVAEAVQPAVDAIRRFAEMISEALAPTLSMIHEVGQSFAGLLHADSTRALGQHLWEIILQLLDTLPGGARVANLLRWTLAPSFSIGDRRYRYAQPAILSNPPPSRATSPSRLVTRSGRNLRGPSHAGVSPIQFVGAEPA